MPIAAGDLGTDRARAMSKIVEAMGNESRRAAMELQGVQTALTPIAQAAPTKPGLAETAQQDVEEAGRRLEQARRSVFRLTEVLPELARAIQEMPGANATTSAGVDVAE